MRILAVDPGKTTGWAFLNTNAYDYHKSPAIVILPQVGEYEWYEFLERYEDWLYSGKIDVTVSESFIISRETLKKTRQNYSLEAIGVMRYMSQRKGREFVLQAPSVAKSFATKEKLDKLGWWPKGQDHAQDASRHLLTYVAAHSTNLGFDLSQIM